MKDFGIVQAKINYADGIASFLQQNFKIHNLKFDKEYIKNSLKNGIWFLSKVNGKTAGIIFLKIIKEDERGELKHLVVKEDFRSKGIGKALLNEAIESAKKKKIRKLTGRVTSSNIKILKGLAENFNFKLEGILKGHYRKNEDVYIYSLFLQK